ncbi:predicted protein [Thalassiosira pseudonana CCMP1335]|uniref:Reverse transcriptase domain-containing protein n=1 Tax=Thalassiosira pseudonana TaxID=35128 RepID=B8CAT6_THAPS|nr:predicted protein [Thalassiosira pseudonana CCMP1335]EED89738.1 predicted protein [Thalassiosira pseudonana CCMP1335]
MSSTARPAPPNPGPDQPRQQYLDTWVIGRPKRNGGGNVEPSGDPLCSRGSTDGILRVAINNINGTTFHQKGFEVAHEIQTIQELGIDIMAMCESNRAWTYKNKQEYERQTHLLWHNTRTVFASCPTGAEGYQPGGNVLNINGPAAGRVKATGTDKWGRFCWMELRGQRDEGWVIISAYRVCQEESHKPGALTAYMQQYTAMLSAGITRPNPRQQILDNLLHLITSKREQGFRPILLMDANEDWVTNSHGKNQLADFMAAANLQDAFYERHQQSPPTYTRGNSRLDYILVDPVALPCIRRVGYLGTHEGNFSDHCLEYVDFDMTTFFRGVTFRPTSIMSREIMLEQADKIESFLSDLRATQNRYMIPERIFRLAPRFAMEGPTKTLIATYNSIDTQLTEMTRSAAKKNGRKKFGFMRSPDLCAAGQRLLLGKAMLSCKARGEPFSQGCIRSAEKLGIDLSEFERLTHTKLRAKVTEMRRDLWEVQKECEERRISWLEGLAQDRARAMVKNDWERVMKDMIRKTEERRVNRKLTTVIKGGHTGMNRVQVPLNEWYVSEHSHELYHYNHGCFEAYPLDTDGLYFPHHTLKVLPDDASPVEVTKMDHNDRYCITRRIPKPPNGWRDITAPVEVEQQLLWRNKRHLQQTTKEQGISTTEPMQSLRRNHGLSNMTNDLLAGQLRVDVEVTETMAAWFKAVAQTDAERHQPPVVGSISTDEYQEMFKAAKERVSSSSSGLHYTLWKAMATDPAMAKFLSIMISLPFIYGFACDRWTNAIDVMLMKKKNNCKIHMLRIIGLLEADLNTALKFFFAKRMMWNAEATGEVSNEQWGGRKNMSSIDAAMLKCLTFESARITGDTIGSIYYDNASCFDRMHPEISNIIARKHNVDTNILKARSIIIHRMRRRVRTSMGTSEEHYGNEDGEDALGGEIQGKGDVPSLWGLQSNTLLKAHQSLCTGLHITNPDRTREMKRNNTAFVDDTDGWASAEFSSMTPIQEVVDRLQHNGQVWNDLTNITGGSIAFHKCKWQLLAWEVVRGELRIVKSTDQRIVLKDNKGGMAVIDFLGPDQPNVGLGYRLCPDGNQTHQLKFVKDAMKEICGALVSAHITQKEALQAMYQRLLPKLDYALHLSHLSERACNDIDVIVNRALLPKLKVNRNMPRDVVYGPLRYGGLGFTDCYTKQSQLQVPYVLKQLRWDKTIGNDMITTLDNIQMASGLVQPLLEYPNPEVDYIDQGFIMSMRKRLSEINASLWVEDCWTPALQRENDTSIMETMVKVKSTLKERRAINQCRIYLQVITIADLADSTGTFIPAGRLTGRWRAYSSLKWPRVAKPSKKAWAVFRRFLRCTFCQDHSPWAGVENSMELTEPLGKWFPVKRHVEFQCYRTSSRLYWRDTVERTSDDGDPEDDRCEDTIAIQVFTEGKTKGYFEYSHDVDEVPLTAHPIAVHKLNDSIWTHRQYRPADLPVQRQYPPGHIIGDTLSGSDLRKLRTGSDGSVIREHQRVAAAWILDGGTGHRLVACVVMANLSSVSSYRAELEGSLRLLHHIEQTGMSTAEIEQWCDNSSAVTAMNEFPNAPGAMLGADADIILAIHKIKQRLSSKFRCQHVYSHQDDPAKMKRIERAKQLAEEKYLRHNPKSRETVPTRVQQRGDEREGDIERNATDTLIENGQTQTRGPSPQLARRDDMNTNAMHHERNIRELAPTELSDEAQLNIACDEYVGDTVAAWSQNRDQPMPQVLEPPYEGSKALLRIGKLWITSDYSKHLHFARRAPFARRYCMRRHKWDGETMSKVDWDAIESHRKTMAFHQVVRSSPGNNRYAQTAPRLPCNRVETGNGIRRDKRTHSPPHAVDIRDSLEPRY